MLSELVRGILPPSWRHYTVPRGCTVIQWVTDFAQRVQQLQQVSQLVSQGGAKELKVLNYLIFPTIMKGMTPHPKIEISQSYILKFQQTNLLHSNFSYKFNFHVCNVLIKRCKKLANTKIGSIR